MSAGNELHIEGFDPEDALGLLSIERFVLDDASCLGSTARLLRIRSRESYAD